MMKVRSVEAGMHWFCLRTKPKKERMAAANVESMFSLEVFCPQIRFRRKTVRGPVWFQEAMFPGYIFARFDMTEMNRAVSHVPGVLNIPVFGGRYVPVPEEVIDSLRNDLDDDGTVEAGLPLNVGDETTILDGSMSGLKVKVIRILPARNRVAVLLEMLGTLVEAEFPPEALEHRTHHEATATD